MLHIGEVARKSQVGVETVRFYEREGLIALPGRSVSGIGSAILRFYAE
jgi:DNA-binding transcriptional MerR regulator